MANVLDEDDAPPPYAQAPPTIQCTAVQPRPFHDHALVEKAVTTAVTRHLGIKAFTKPQHLAALEGRELSRFRQRNNADWSANTILLWRFVCHVLCCDYRLYDEERACVLTWAAIDDKIRSDFYKLAFDVRALASLCQCGSNRRKRRVLQDRIAQSIEEPSAELGIPMSITLNMVLRYAMFIDERGFYPPAGAMQGIMEVFGYEDVIFKIKNDLDLVIDSCLVLNSDLGRACQWQAERTLEHYRARYLGRKARPPGKPQSIQNAYRELNPDTDFGAADGRRRRRFGALRRLWRWETAPRARDLPPAFIDLYNPITC